MKRIKLACREHEGYVIVASQDTSVNPVTSSLKLCLCGTCAEVEWYFSLGCKQGGLLGLAYKHHLLTSLIILGCISVWTVSVWLDNTLLCFS